MADPLVGESLIARVHLSGKSGEVDITKPHDQPFSNRGQIDGHCVKPKLLQIHDPRACKPVEILAHRHGDGIKHYARTKMAEF